MPTISKGSTAYAPTVAGGTELDVYGSAFSAQVQANGLLVVESGGYVSGSVISAAGEQDVEGGGTDVGTTVQGNGYEVVYGGSVANTTVSGLGADQQVYGGTVLSATLLSRGEQDVNGGTVTSTTVGSGAYEYIGGGTVDDTVVNAGGYAVISAGVLSDATINTGGTETITKAGLTSATDLENGGRIDLSYLTFATGGSAELGANDVLSVTVGGKTTTVSLAGGYVGEYFDLSQDAGGGTLVTETVVPCLCSGTLVTTDCADVPVEALAAGNLVLTASGQHRPIRWIGRRSYAGRFLRANPDVQPVRFRAGSLGNGLPRRDLLVSPNHCMFLDGALVPAKLLVNGTTIVKERGLAQVDYFHVELDGHDVLLAEGAPSESFVDDDSRGMFHNAAEWERLYPGRDHMPAVFCAPRVESGPELEAIRRRLNRAAGDVAQAA